MKDPLWCVLMCCSVLSGPAFNSGLISRANLAIVKELSDRAAQGRTYGNLGNTYYLLGHFREAVASHEQVCCSSKSCVFAPYWDTSINLVFSSVQRLLIAKEFGDRAAERRAYCNLGNTYIFLGEFEVAAEHYK